MISLPRGDIRIGLPPKAKRAKKQTERRAAMAQGQNWRMHRSNAMGVHFTQVAEYRQFVKDNGITGVEYKDNGDCYLSSRHSMKTLVKKLERVNFDENS
jgi:hypothetical protein